MHRRNLLAGATFKYRMVGDSVEVSDNTIFDVFL